MTVLHGGSLEKGYYPTLSAFLHRWLPTERNVRVMVRNVFTIRNRHDLLFDGEIMFSYLKAMYHQSKIQAELKAQIHEQTTVNAICHHPESIEIIAVCSTDAYYRKRKDAPFLTTCTVLMRTLKDESVPMVLRKTAWRLLNERVMPLIS